MTSERHSRNGFLCRKGLEEAAERHSLEGLAPRGEVDYVDRVGSVSGLVEVEGLYAFVSDSEIDEQYRRDRYGS